MMYIYIMILYIPNVFLNLFHQHFDDFNRTKPPWLGRDVPATELMTFITPHLTHDPEETSRELTLRRCNSRVR